MSNIPTLATVLDILAHEILVQLDLVDIQALSQCSTNLRTLVPPAGFVAHHRLKNVLEQYFDDVDKFKSVLREQNALVGGSTVLSLCRPSRAWVARDLDVVVEEVKVGGVEKFLKKEGYEMQDGKLLDDTYYSGPGGPTSALAFEWSRWTRGKRSIDVSVVARVTPVEYVLTYASISLVCGLRLVELTSRPSAHDYAYEFLRWRLNRRTLPTSHVCGTFSAQFLHDDHWPETRRRHPG